MFKKIDIYLVKSFIGPFMVTFLVTLFVLVMQFFFVYMDELLGKGLSIFLIIELLFLMSSTLVPMALPLGILTGSIMTFGSFAENSELVALKSSGISLYRIIQPVFLFVAALSIGGFYFNNNVIPVANLKAFTLLHDMRNSKPALNIIAGQFNSNIPGFSILVGSKDKDGKTIRDIVIYEKGEYNNLDKIVVAKKGEMLASADRKYMIFRLEDGCRYEDADGGADARNKKHFIRLNFKRWDKVFDLSALKMTRSNEEGFKKAYQMMNVWQLQSAIDTLHMDMDNMYRSLNAESHQFLSFTDTAQKELKAHIDTFMSRDKPVAAAITADSSLNQGADTSFSLFSQVPDSVLDKARVNAAINARYLKAQAERWAYDEKLRNENIIQYTIEWHRKFTLSFSCILLFLIGAPLGAIIRKGGLGLPMIIAIVFFLIWYIISFTGEKVAKSSDLPIVVGMWVSTVILLPIAIFFMVKAKNDSAIFNKDTYVMFFRKWLGFISKKKQKA